MNPNHKGLYERFMILKEENKRLRDEVELLRKILSKEEAESNSPTDFTMVKETSLDQKDSLVTMNSPSEEKIRLFMTLFKGRNDVCAKRWRNKPGYSPYCFNDFRPGICNKPKVRCSKCKCSDFAALDEERIEGHLLGKYVLGLYPMTSDDTCFLLAIDFDETTWVEDIKVIVKIFKRIIYQYMLNVHALEMDASMVFL